MGRAAGPVSWVMLPGSRAPTESRRSLLPWRGVLGEASGSARGLGQGNSPSRPSRNASLPGCPHTEEATHPSLKIDLPKNRSPLKVDPGNDFSNFGIWPIYPPNWPNFDRGVGGNDSQ